MDKVYEYLYDAYENGRALLDGEKYVEEISQLVHHSNEFVRADLAKALVNDAPDRVAMKLLLDLCTDSEWCVRIEAIDSLSEFPYEESFYALESGCNDDDELIRAYAIYGLCIVAQELGGSYKSTAIEDMQRLQSVKQTAFVQVNIYGGLYILGQKNYLQPLIALISSEDYHVKCAVFRTLADIYCPENSDVIVQVLQKFDEDELPVAVKEAYRELKQVVQSSCS